jgi:putative sigma-54 modulation protein
MQIHLTPRHLTLTASIHQAAAKHVQHLESFSPDIIAAHVVLVADLAAKPGRRHIVKVHLAVPGPDIFAEHANDDLYVALEMVCDKISTQLRKRKTALSDKRRRTTQRAVEQQRNIGTIPQKIRKGVKAASR